jgi:hypothetical protein
MSLPLSIVDPGANRFDRTRIRLQPPFVQYAINQRFRDGASPAELWQPRCLNESRDAVLAPLCSAIAGRVGTY